MILAPSILTVKEEERNNTLQELYDIIIFINYLDLDNTLFRKEV